MGVLREEPELFAIGNQHPALAGREAQQGRDGQGMHWMSSLSAHYSAEAIFEAADPLAATPNNGCSGAASYRGSTLSMAG